MDPPGGQFPPAPPDQFSGAPTALPSRRAPQSPGQHSSPPAHSQPSAPGRGQQAQRPAPAASAGFVPPQTPYGSASRPAASPPAALPSAPPPAGGSLDDTVTAAHAEGFDFGESVARDAPALWLEAVLARKPRMPTDLEARLLQGSALPIDSLLHDEVRHALRRGFWDALERSRH